MFFLHQKNLTKYQNVHLIYNNSSTSYSKVRLYHLDLQQIERKNRPAISLYFRLCLIRKSKVFLLVQVIFLIKLHRGILVQYMITIAPSFF